jgi:hypothetical protein
MTVTWRRQGRHEGGGGPKVSRPKPETDRETEREREERATFCLRDRRPSSPSALLSPKFVHPSVRPSISRPLRESALGPRPPAKLWFVCVCVCVCWSRARAPQRGWQLRPPNITACSSNPSIKDDPPPFFNIELSRRRHRRQTGGSDCAARRPPEHDTQFGCLGGSSALASDTETAPTNHLWERSVWRCAARARVNSPRRATASQPQHVKTSHAHRSPKCAPWLPPERDAPYASLGGRCGPTHQNGGGASNFVVT